MSIKKEVETYELVNEDRPYKYTLEYIGIHDTSKGFHLLQNGSEKLICCDGTIFNIEVACDILNELNNKVNNNEG